MSETIRKSQKLSDDCGVIQQIDRISSLPEPIISHILSFLPTKSAVATGFVSKSWKHRWTGLTSFDFDDDWWRNRSKKSSRARDNGAEDPNKMRFVDFVNMVLINLNTEISMAKFRLKVNNRKFLSIHLNIWINFAIARKIRVLDLVMMSSEFWIDNWDHDLEFYLPSVLYNCGTLEVLKLQGPFLFKAPHVICLPKLVDLELLSVKFDSAESFRKLISGCEALQCLRIVRNHFTDGLQICNISSLTLKRLVINIDFDECYCDQPGEYKLKIDTPAVEYLVLNDCVSDEISMQGLTSLNEAVLDGRRLTIGLLEACDQGKVLEFPYKVIYNNIIPPPEGTDRFSVSFKWLTNLKIQKDRSAPLGYFMDLFDFCCQLKVLVIENGFFGSCFHYQKRYWRDPINVPRCLLYSLTEISYKGLEGTEDELAMLNFVLNHALVMKSVHIYSSVLSEKENNNLLKELLEFSRVSRACKITFDELAPMDVPG
ncbi:OLC1v1036000C1 [Oldenlandia corymbosa var. corymbosa]|uniref:OLC1v1036000C1 n=1 Tax=Oldenlandia corymbosa var. corymbosa TaxID=529605 RepID=A0AAV1CUW2_OLDCO|nr:OLC1v1036000C1 [Oldenlandia corymbosa var. corymbosa]